MTKINPKALFRYGVLGSLTTQEELAYGELTKTIQNLATKHYDIPDSDKTTLSYKVIESWYYTYKKGGLDALIPKERKDKGHSNIRPEIQEAIIELKKEKPQRSTKQIIKLLESKALIGKKEVTRSSCHRLLQKHGLSKQIITETQPEHRSFEAKIANAIWQSDVMHGPNVLYDGKLRKAYLISFLDDRSRLLTHSAFCLNETAIALEYVLKQAVLKRGIPKLLLIDNGAAYRSATLISICARLNIQIVYCKPYQPEAKGKIERLHRTIRKQFLIELDHEKHLSLSELNSLYWHWVEEYHRSEHSTLKTTPLLRYQEDLRKIRPIGKLATQLDDIFCHREQRKVRKDGTIAFNGQYYEVNYAWVGQTIELVIEPHDGKILRAETRSGESEKVTLLDRYNNLNRKRN